MDLYGLTRTLTHAIQGYDREEANSMFNANTRTYNSQSNDALAVALWRLTGRHNQLIP